MKPGAIQVAEGFDTCSHPAAVELEDKFADGRGLLAQRVIAVSELKHEEVHLYNISQKKERQILPIYKTFLIFSHLIT